MKTVYILLGFLFFGLGAVGALLPVLPTTPFLLLASFCFARGSQRFHRWLCATTLYQKHLESFVQDRAMPLKTKVSIMALATTMLLLAFIMMSNIPGRIVIVLVIVAKYYYFLFRIRTIWPEKKPVATPENKSGTAAD